MNAWDVAAPFDQLAFANQIRFQNSVENKVLEFFDRNPDEELAASDVVLKYGYRLDSASKLLKSMQSRGLLQSRHEGRLRLYRRFA